MLFYIYCIFIILKSKMIYQLNYDQSCLNLFISILANSSNITHLRIYSEPQVMENAMPTPIKIIIKNKQIATSSKMPYLQTDVDYWKAHCF